MRHLPLRYRLCLASCLAACVGFGQDLTLAGVVVDGASGEPLAGVTLRETATGSGTATGPDGAFAFALPASLAEADSVAIAFSYVGYDARTLRFALGPARDLRIALSPGTVLEAVEVRAGGVGVDRRSAQTSVEQLTVAEVKLVPALLGESDLLRVLQLKPGIPSGSEGATGIYVRGGGTDQNLFLLDGATVYNPNHLFGFFSTFNTDAVEGLTLYKGGFPSQFGGRLSSVVEVTPRDGNPEAFGVTGGIGLVASRVSAEGPLDKAKRGSFIVGARRTYVDVFTEIANRALADVEDFNPIPAYNFYDTNARLTYRLGARDRVSVGGYFGRDRFRLDSESFDFRFRWGNAAGTARWNHLFGERASLSMAVTFSDYRYAVTNAVAGFSFELGSAVQDVGLRSELLLDFGDEHTLRTGVEATRHRFTVGRLNAGTDDGDIAFASGDTLRATAAAAYAQYDVKLADRLRLRGGLRLSSFARADTGDAYARLEPRIAASADLNDHVTLKASYARMYQYVHLVQSAGLALPTDVWYPSSPGVGPQRSDQIALGAAIALPRGLTFSVEGYRKWLDGQVDFVDGANLFVNEDLEGEFDTGRGDAYGVEVQLERRVGKLTGWVGYTWQRTRRGEFARIMGGRYFSPRYDRRHDVSVVGMYKLSRRWTVNATWVYGSGDLTWVPTGRFIAQEVPGADFQAVAPVYEDRNNFRLRPFHRADVGAVFRLRPKRGEGDLTFSVFNVYDRRNTFFVYIDAEYAGLPEGEEPESGIRVPERLVAKQVSLFPVLPSVTWNFTF